VISGWLEAWSRDQLRQLPQVLGGGGEEKRLCFLESGISGPKHSGPRSPSSLRASIQRRLDLAEPGCARAFRSGPGRLRAWGDAWWRTLSQSNESPKPACLPTGKRTGIVPQNGGRRLF